MQLVIDTHRDTLHRLERKFIDLRKKDSKVSASSLPSTNSRLLKFTSRTQFQPPRFLLERKHFLPYQRETFL